MIKCFVASVTFLCPSRAHVSQHFLVLRACSCIDYVVSSLPEMADTTLPRAKVVDNLVWALKQIRFESRLKKNLTDVKKLKHLKKTLEGNAESCIKELVNTDDNYPRAWEILRSLKQNELFRFRFEDFASTLKNPTNLLTKRAAPSIQQYLQLSYDDRFIIESMHELRDFLSHEAKLLVPVNAMVKLLIEVMALEREEKKFQLLFRKDMCRELMRELSLLDVIRIPPFPEEETRESWEVHGFSSASEKTLGAVVYIRYRYGNQYVVSPISAIAREPTKRKTKKDKDSEARLELCGAELLAKIVKNVVLEYRLQGVPIHLWTHSTCVLEWIHGGSSWWKESVESKVKSIEDLTPEAHWCHVEEYLNPACVAFEERLLADLRIWWHGPPYLHDITFNPNKL